MDKPTNGIGYEFDERVFRKRKPIKINLSRNGTVKVAIPQHSITPYLQQAETQARQFLLYAFPKLSTPNSQVKDVNAAKAVNP